MDALAESKQVQREGWAHFAPLEATTTPAAARLVRHAGVGHGMRVLDVGCGTGVVAITAARLGAHAIGVDASRPQVWRDDRLFNMASRTARRPHHGTRGQRLGDWKEQPFTQAGICLFRPGTSNAAGYALCFEGHFGLYEIC